MHIASTKWEIDVKKLVAVVAMAAVLASVPYGLVAKGKGKGVKKSSAHAAETTFGNARGYGWQERARVCVALTPEQCTAVVQLQTGGGDGSGAGASSGDSGSAGASGNGAAGGSGGATGGNGCSR